MGLAMVLVGLALLAPAAARVPDDLTIPASHLPDDRALAGVELRADIALVRARVRAAGADLRNQVTRAGAHRPDEITAPAATRVDTVDSRRSAVRREEDPPGRRGRDAVTFTVVAGGDVLPHEPVIAAARRRGGGYDFRPLLVGIRAPVTAADLALCHLEVPLTRNLGALSGYPVFNAPAHLADALAATGFDGCSVASNHALDKGAAGVASTLRALADADLAATGTARSPRERRRIRMYRVRGVRVAHLSFTYGLNGYPGGPADRWRVNIIEPTRILADARRARRRGARMVLVSLHWGQEYRSRPTVAQRRLAGRLLASSAVDVIIGHHAHVVQPVARRHGKVVAYGLGNLLSNQTASCCVAAAQDGVLLRLVVRARADGAVRVRRVEYLPTMVRHPARRVVLVTRALRRTSRADDTARLRASLRRTRSAIGDLAVLAR